MALDGVVLDVRGGAWHVRDEGGGVLPLSPRFERAWHILAATGGRPFGLAGEYDGATLEPLAYWFGGAFRPLPAGPVEPSPSAPPPLDAPAELAALWREVAAAALVGVERRPPPAVPEPFAAVVPGLDELDPPARLLGLAASVSWYGRVGREAATDPGPPPAACGPDDRPACGPAPAARLRAMLDGDRPRHLPEWLGLLAAAGRRLPDDAIPDVLDHARRSTALRPAVAAVLGARGHWLASKNPDWGFVAGDLRGLDPAAVWQTGRRPERVAALETLRRDDPARGRDLLAGAWAAEPADERAAFLAALATGLAADDEPFLEAALDDRSKPVRAAAAGLLARLPGSALGRRMAARAARCLAWDGRAVAVAVTLPEACDKGMVRDGVEPKPPRGTGERAWWLHQVVAAVPPSFWCREWGVAPARVVQAAAAGSGEWADLLWESWAAAAHRHGDAAWAVALLENAPESAGAASEHAADLLALLGDAERDAFLRDRLAARAGPLDARHPAFVVFRRAGGRFGPELARAVLARVRELAEAEAAHTAALRSDVPVPAARFPVDQETYEFLTGLVDRLPPALAAEAAPDPPAGPARLPYADAYRQLREGLRFRHEMHEEFRR